MHPHTPTHLGHCSVCHKHAVVTHCDYADDFWCDNCLTNQAERDWERHCAAFHDGGDTSFIPLYQQQLLSRKLK